MKTIVTIQDTKLYILENQPIFYLLGPYSYLQLEECQIQKGAAILLESLDKITDDKSLEIDPKHLRKQGAALRVKLEKIIQCQDLRTQPRSITRVT
jgi:hypothetical protein